MGAQARQDSQALTFLLLVFGVCVCEVTDAERAAVLDCSHQNQYLSPLK